MRLVALDNIAAGEQLAPGAVFETDDADAARLIKLGVAEKAPEPAKADEKPKKLRRWGSADVERQGPHPTPAPTHTMALLTSAEAVISLGRTTALALLDDDDNGDVDPALVAQIIERVEAEVYSYVPLAFETSIPFTGQVATLLRSACLDYFKAFAYERHPEYVRTYNVDAKGLFARAQTRMERIVQGLQRVTDGEPQASTGGVVDGGVVTFSGPRTLIDNADGTTNLGDF